MTTTHKYLATQFRSHADGVCQREGCPQKNIRNLDLVEDKNTGKQIWVGGNCTEKLTGVKRADRFRWHLTKFGRAYTRVIPEKGRLACYFDSKKGGYVGHIHKDGPAREKIELDTPKPNMVEAQIELLNMLEKMDTI